MHNLTEQNESRTRRAALWIALAAHIAIAGAVLFSAFGEPEKSKNIRPAKTETSHEVAEAGAKTVSPQLP